jgi:hypothetical protein
MVGGSNPSGRAILALGKPCTLGAAMAYLADLSPYTYWPLPAGLEAKAFAVGWLAKGRGFHKGPVDEGFIEALFRGCRSHRAMQTRGFHLCEFCPSRPPWPPETVERDGHVVSLGSAEVWVVGDDGNWYCAPNLVLHYVMVHQYRPPEQFVAGVRAGRFIQCRGAEEGWSLAESHTPSD